MTDWCSQFKVPWPKSVSVSSRVVVVLFCECLPKDLWGLRIGRTLTLTSPRVITAAHLLHLLSVNRFEWAGCSCYHETHLFLVFEEMTIHTNIMSTLTSLAYCKTLLIETSNKHTYYYCCFISSTTQFTDTTRQKVHPTSRNSEETGWWKLRPCIFISSFGFVCCSERWPKLRQAKTS